MLARSMIQGRLAWLHDAPLWGALLPQVDMVAARVPAVALVEVLSALAEALGECPHLEFLLRWVRAVCLHHGAALQARALAMSSASFLLHPERQESVGAQDVPCCVLVMLLRTCAEQAERARMRPHPSSAQSAE